MQICFLTYSPRLFIKLVSLTVEYSQNWSFLMTNINRLNLTMLPESQIARGDCQGGECFFLFAELFRFPLSVTHSLLPLCFYRGFTLLELPFSFHDLEHSRKTLHPTSHQVNRMLHFWAPLAPCPCHTVLQSLINVTVSTKILLC